MRNLPIDTAVVSRYCIGVPSDHNFHTAGQLVQHLLKKRGWSQRVLAIVLGIDETGINRIVADKRPVDAKMALVLEEVFSVPAEQFLELQKSYDLAKARIVAQPDPGRAIRAYLFGDLPIAEMIKRGWLTGASDIRNVRQVEASLVLFFGVASSSEIEILPHAARKTAVNMPTTPSQLAWLYRVKQIAGDMLVGRYSRNGVLSAVNTLRSLLISPDAARKVTRIMAECGIRYVIVESLQSAKIDGVCFWLDDRSPVIGMSLRYDRIDNFWFVLRHEIEHVLRGQGRAVAMLDTELEGERALIGDTIPKEERVANEAAADFCVPQSALDRFIARKAPSFWEKDILGFAKTISVHPGLVAGQLQHRTLKYDKFRNHLVKIRSAATSGAVVDGWGNVAPVGE